MRARIAVACIALVAGSCVTVYEDAPLIDVTTAPPEFAVAQSIPFGSPDASPEERLLAQIYDGVLRDMQRAVVAGDADELRGLLAAYDKPKLPPVIRDRIDGFRLLEIGLRFTNHAAAKSTLAVVTHPDADPIAVASESTAPTVVVPPIGKPVHLEFVLPPHAEAVHLGGRGETDPIGFAIAMEIEDWFVDGGSRTERRHDLQWLQDGFDLDGTRVLRQPFTLEVDAGRAVRRTVTMRIDLVGGYVGIDGKRVPLPRRRTLAALRFVQWPAGHEPIQRRPLDTLREALRIGDAAHLPHVFLGATFTSGADREQALLLLIEQVRMGSLQLADVAMATLRDLTGVDIAIGDREGWLAWWGMRH